MPSTRRIQVEYIPRVEGEGGIQVALVGGKLKEVRVPIFEAARFFEGFLVGRGYYEVPDLTARVCGICPASYQMASSRALEKALGITPGPQTVALRTLFSHSEIMQSNLLHIYMLAAPDYLGYNSIIDLARDHAPDAQRGIELRRVANALMQTIGGRTVLPVAPTVTGFTHVPTRSQMADIAGRMERALPLALETVSWVSHFPYPDFLHRCEHLATWDPDRYAVNADTVRSTGGLAFPVEQFPEHVEVSQVPWSNALHVTLKGGGTYLTGPLARVNLNFDQLSPLARQAARESGISFPSFNPFHSEVARAVEVVHCLEDSLTVINGLAPHDEKVEVIPRAGEGFAITEAPRGMLYHHYKLSGDGTVMEATLMPPTEQALADMEAGLREYVPRLIDLPADEVKKMCEAYVRSYDPCISCATH